MSLFIVKWRCRGRIDEVASEVRGRFITIAAGQDAVYAAKRSEALAFINDYASNPATAVPGPHIAAEAAAVGRAPIELANEVVASSQSWLTLYSPSIEAARRSGKDRVDSAIDEASALAAGEAAEQALRALFS